MNYIVLISLIRIGTSQINIMDMLDWNSNHLTSAINVTDKMSKGLAIDYCCAVSMFLFNCSYKAASQ